MNLAEATTALTQKDSEKATVVAEIEKVKEQKAKGIAGLLRISVYQVDGLPEDSKCSFSYIIDTHKAETEDNLQNKGLSEDVHVKLNSFEQLVFVECRVISSASSADSAEGTEAAAAEHVYSVKLNVIEVTGETELHTALEASCLTDNRAVTLHIKAGLDIMHMLLESKEKELEQLQKEFEDIAMQVKEAKQKQTNAASVNSKSGGKKKSTKKTQSKKKQSIEEEAGDEAEGEGGQRGAGKMTFESVTQSLQEGAMVACMLALQHRAYLLFGLASVGIFLYGDYASV